MDKSKLLMLISTKAQAKKWIEQCVKEFGGGFHPDNKAEEYVRIHTGQPTFTYAEAKQFNHNLNVAWEVLGKKIYSIGLKAAMDKMEQSVKASNKWVGGWK